MRDAERGRKCVNANPLLIGEDIHDLIHVADDGMAKQVSCDRLVTGGYRDAIRTFFPLPGELKARYIRVYKN